MKRQKLNIDDHTNDKEKTKFNIAFIHPDLGIGGAERLVCDAALALQGRGHVIRLYTSHHEASHCFKETADGTLDVTAVGDWLPRHTFGRFFAFWAYVRMIYVSLYVALFCPVPDVIVCDQVSACIPVLRLLCSKKTRVLFYCHFPDMLLTQRKSWMKRFYRAPLDWLEEYTTGLADTILVNSQFTASVYHDTFKRLSSPSSNVNPPEVLYPSLNFDAFDRAQTEDGKDGESHGTQQHHCDEQMLRKILCLPDDRSLVFLSINRYERKKNLALAVNAMRKIKDICSSKEWQKVHLIMAGGYDERVLENKEYHAELVSLSRDIGVQDHVTFMCSFSDEQKVTLLQMATCLLYTPSGEHFGIVPIEAMYMRCPVIACNSGGPRETVQHEETGYLCEPNASDFALRMTSFVRDVDLGRTLGEKGRSRVIKNFSFQAFTSKLDDMILSTSKKSRQDSSLLLQFSILALVIVALLFCKTVIRMFF